MEVRDFLFFICVGCILKYYNLLVRCTYYIHDVYTYLYDATGIAGIRHNNKYYYFLKTQQGDIKYIVDEDGIHQAEYVYDAWGNCQILVNGVDITDNSDYNTHIAKVNPFRYRGYYFDSETGLYYLNSRYYDPATRRFINADDPSIPVLEQATDIGGLNLYSYCLNNPVNYADYNGDYLHLILGGIIGGILGGVASAISGGDVIDIIIGVVFGAAGGVLAASGAGVVIQALGSSALAMISNAAQQINHIVKDETNSTTFNIGDMLFDGVVGLVAGAIGGNGASYGSAKHLNKAGSRLIKKVILGDGKKAWKYYVKTAHVYKRKFVFRSVLKSLSFVAVGNTVITAKNYLT